MTTIIREKNEQLTKQLANQHVIDFMTIANRIARDSGYGFATSIVRGDENKVIGHTPYGYRKYTTGEYVPNSYRSNFGWKNTYYQNAETEIMLQG